MLCCLRFIYIGNISHALLLIESLHRQENPGPDAEGLSQRPQRTPAVPYPTNAGSFVIDRLCGLSKSSQLLGTMLGLKLVPDSS